jgi:hypothetical protein
MGAQTLFFCTLCDREPILDLFERLDEVPTRRSEIIGAMAAQKLAPRS